VAAAVPDKGRRNPDGRNVVAVYKGRRTLDMNYDSCIMRPRESRDITSAGLDKGRRRTLDLTAIPR
jgi:hypothetical protein